MRVMGDMEVEEAPLVVMVVAMMAALVVPMEGVVAPSMGAEGVMVAQVVADTILMQDRMSFDEGFLGL